MCTAGLRRSIGSMRRSNKAMWRVLRHIVRKYPEERRKGKGEAGRRGGEREGTR